MVVAGAVCGAIAKLGLRYPEVGPEKKKELAAARTQLLREGQAKKGKTAPDVEA